MIISFLHSVNLTNYFPVSIYKEALHPWTHYNFVCVYRASCICDTLLGEYLVGMETLCSCLSLPSISRNTCTRLQSAWLQIRKTGQCQDTQDWCKTVGLFWFCIFLHSGFRGWPYSILQDYVWRIQTFWEVFFDHASGCKHALLALRPMILRISSSIGYVWFSADAICCSSIWLTTFASLALALAPSMLPVTKQLWVTLANASECNA